MARIGRIVFPDFPHHVTQRGNRRQQVFFEPSDYALYRDLLAERCRKASVAVWAYCLMPTPDGLARAIGETHRQYTGFINARSRWTGHLFQGRFSSVALDEAYLVAAARYVALNPVRARLVARAQDWAWSSARAHLAGRDDGLVCVAPLIERVGRFADLIDAETDHALFTALREAEGTSRPLGSAEFVAELERRIGRGLRRQKPGRKANAPTEQLELGLSEMGKVSP
jgi:putative transposase